MLISCCQMADHHPDPTPPSFTLIRNFKGLQFPVNILQFCVAIYKPQLHQQVQVEVVLWPQMWFSLKPTELPLSLKPLLCLYHASGRLFCIRLFSNHSVGSLISYPIPVSPDSKHQPLILFSVPKLNTLLYNESL